MKLIISKRKIHVVDLKILKELNNLMMKMINSKRKINVVDLKMLNEMNNPMKKMINPKKICKLKVLQKENMIV